MTDWRTLIPSEFVSLTECYYIVKRNKICSYDIDIVICTAHGQLFEFFDRRIVGSCVIPYTQPKSITLFTTYGLKINIYYIIEAENEIVIVSRVKELQIIKKYKNVKKFLVSDFSNVGFPQLGIWTGDMLQEMPDIVVDLNEDNSREQEEDDCTISNFLSQRYRELCLQVESHENKLKIIKQQKLLNCESAAHSTATATNKEFPQVVLVGNKDLFDKKLNLRREDLQEGGLSVGDTWQRIHNEKWVVGIFIINNGKECFDDVRLVLSCQEEDELRYHTKLLMYQDCEPSPAKRMKLLNSAGRAVASWREVTTTVEPQRRVVLTGVLQIPNFISQSIVKLSGFIAYKMKNSTASGKCVSIPSFELKVVDYSRNIGAPFSLEPTDADVLCLLVSSYTTTLPISFKSSLESSLMKILINDLKFVEFSSLGCLFHKGLDYSELAGMMLLIENEESEKYKLTVCARDVQQVYLLVNCMYSVLSAPYMVVYPPEESIETLSDVAVKERLTREFEMVLTSLQTWVTSSNDRSSIVMLDSEIQVPREEYFDFREKMLDC